MNNFFICIFINKKMFFIGRGERRKLSNEKLIEKS